MQPQPGAIAQAAQPAPRMNPRTSAALMEMVRGQGGPDNRGMSVPMDERVRRMSGLQKGLGDDQYSELVKALLMQEAPMLEAQQGGMGGLMELIKSLGGSQPQHTPNQMLQQMRAPR